jgi:hypothetical protein
MNSIARRIAAGAALFAAPALIALGTATAGHAETTTIGNGPSVSAPAFHKAFPTQDLSTDQPGTSSHHHHQWHHHTR